MVSNGQGGGFVDVVTIELISERRRKIEDHPLHVLDHLDSTASRDATIS